MANIADFFAGIFKLVGKGLLESPVRPVFPVHRQDGSVWFLSAVAPSESMALGCRFD